MALWSVLNSRTRSVIESSSKTVMGHWPIESSNLSLSATPSRPESARAVGGGLEVLYRRLFHWSGWSRTFRGNVRYFRPETASGLAVIDIPAAVTKELGGIKQLKVKGVINGVEFTSNTMPLMTPLTLSCLRPPS